VKEEKMDALILDMGNDVKGECSRPGYEKKIELLTFGQGDSGRMGGGISSSERTSGRPEPEGVTVTKYLDSVSSDLNRACMEGRRFPQVEIIVGRNEGGKIVELIRYKMSNVTISSVSVSGGGGDKPEETLKLDYDKITWRYI
jgi:type VI secretion system secreted protein Hcp